MTETAIKTVDTQPLATQGTGVDMQKLMELAIGQGADGVDSLTKLYELDRQMVADAAKREFSIAFAKFQEECPLVIKSRTANVPTKTGGSYSFDYANADDILRVVRPCLTKNGLALQWNSSKTENDVTQVCTLHHVSGHSISSESTMPIKSRAGMDAQPELESSTMYARKNALSDVLGVVTSDAGPPQDDPGPVLSEVQCKEIERLMEATGSNRKSFLAWADAERVEDIRQKQYTGAISLFKVRAAQQKKESK